jgi:uncharacterized protein (DUF58 family)
VRLATTDGVTSDHGTGHQHLENLLERLALIQPTPAANLRASIDRLATLRDGDGGGHGVLIAVLARATPDEMTALGRLVTRFESVTIVEAGDAGGEPSGNGHTTPAGAGVVVVQAGGNGFARAWNRMVAVQASKHRRRTTSGVGVMA